ncbi:hypothetical protein GX411_03535 [Candidatus Fermentibacteria bacterium]|nr:hypothetical protein [Candidatus Fermentibacteria bacterium]
MKVWRISIPVMLAAASPVLSRSDDPSSSALAFFDALRTGDSAAVDSLASSQALEVVELMLADLRNSLRNDRDATMTRLRAAGYPADAGEPDEWTPREYLRLTVSLPIMTARYSTYSMEITGESRSGRRATLSVTFTGSSGIEIPSVVVLEEEDGIWKVSSFMGLNSFP